MKTLKQVGFKLIVVWCILATFFCFIANTQISFASKVKTDSFYYSGTTKGSYVVEKSFWESLLNALGEILDYILGIMTMGLRIVFVGWTALLEQCLTWLIEGATGTEVNVQDVEPVGLANPDDYITIESIVFNKVFLFNINVFDYKVDDTHNSLGQELKEGEVSDITEDSFVNVLKETVASWYYSFRLVSLMAMLILLIYIGIKLAIASSAKQKALYKQVLTDWVVGLVLVFFIHYIILAMILFNELLVTQISKMNLGYGGEKAVYEYGIKERGEKEISNAELEMSIYDEVRTRAYDAKLTVGTVGMVLYMVLVYYAWKFSFMYLKRYLVVAVLIMMAPFIALTYAYNKIRSGKTPIFTNWLKELFFMIIIQSVHALIYVMFFREALAIALSSIGGMILAFVILHFATKAEEIFRKIFGINGNLTNDVTGTKLQDIGKMASSASLGVASSKTAAKMTKGAARIASKPIRLAANAGFGKYMEFKANKILAKDEEKEANGELTYEEEKTRDRINRNNTYKLGDLAKTIPKRKEDLSEEERNALLELRKAIPMKNSNNELMSEEEYIDNFYDKRQKFSDDYDKLMSVSSRFKNKWKEIMDPFQYVDGEYEKNAEGKMVATKYNRKKTKYEHENWGPILKHLSKKEDGVGKALSKYGFDYIFDMNKEKKAAFKAQTQLMKSAIVGFSGILIGLPLAIAEPGVGAVFLAKGISESRKVYGGQNRAKYKNLQGFAMDHKGKYHFVGYNAKAVETMADGMQAHARDSIDNYVESVEDNNNAVRKRVKKHKKLYQNIKLSGDLSNLHLRESFRVTSNPVRAIGTIATGNVLTGHIFGNINMNAYLAYHEAVRASRTRTAKEFEEDISSTDAFLNHLADMYNDVEEQKQDLAQSRLTKEMEKAYGNGVDKIIEDVDGMTDRQLIIQLGEHDEIVVETTIDGRKQLSGASEAQIIEQSILEAAQKSGLASLEEYHLEGNKNKMEMVKKIATAKLAKQGVITGEQTAGDIITDLDNKILQHNAKIVKNEPNAVRDKIIDDVIIDEMKAGKVDNPELISSDTISNKAGKLLVSVPTDKSSKVVSELSSGRSDSSSSPITKEAISSRKTIIASKLEKEMSQSEREYAKDRVRKKKLRELDTEIISRLSSDNSSDSEQSTQASTDETNAVVKMLQLNTEREQARKQAIEVKQKTKEDRRKMYLSTLYDSDGRIDSKALAKGLKARDGSRKVRDNYNSRVDENLGNDDVLTIMRKVMEQKNI